MTMEQKLTTEIEQHRDKLVENLGRIAGVSDSPLEAGHPNVESAVMARTKEIAKITGEQHSRCHQIRALKCAVRWLREAGGQEANLNRESEELNGETKP